MHPRILLALVALAMVAGAALAPGGAAVARGPGPLPEPLGVWPLTPVPEVLAGFDPPDQPWGSGHRGVDLAGSPGQVVRAALAGTVRFAGRLAGRGVVVVDHGDTRTTYEPVLATPAVGDPVARGQPIGTLDLAGSHCLPARLPALGLAPGRPLPRPAGPRRRRAGAAAAAVARLPCTAPGRAAAGPAGRSPAWWPAVLAAHARGCACR